MPLSSTERTCLFWALSGGSCVCVGTGAHRVVRGSDHGSFLLRPRFAPWREHRRGGQWRRDHLRPKCGNIDGDHHSPDRCDEWGSTRSL